MTTEVNKYRVWCIEEVINVYVWSDVEPTICPNDHADRTIDSAQTKILETLDVNTIKVEEDTDGYFETTHVIQNIPSGTPGDITEHDVSWPMNILLWRTLLTPTSDMIGDSMSVLASPETTVGVITSTVNIGDTVLNVNSTVVDNVQRGFLITVDDTVNKDVLGRCIAIDTVNSTITVETPTSFGFSAGTPVKISIYILKDILILNTEIIDIGSKGFKGKKLDAGVVLRVYYTNNSGTSKDISWRPEYYNLN